MGLGNIIFLIVAPLGGMTIAAFSLKKQLPKACRLFGNYIGLSYVYFKSILKILKPKDHMTYQMIDIARRASQQSQALKRQLRNTVKSMKAQIKQKRNQTFKQFEKQFPILQNQLKYKQNQQASNVSKNTSNISSGYVLIQIQKQRKQLIQNKMNRKKANKFFQEI